MKKASVRAYRQQPPKFKKLREPKVAKFKGGYSSDASLVFQSWLKDIQVYTIEHHLSQLEARKTEDAFTDELQILVRKIIARKPEFINEANEALKHQFAQNLRDPYFGVVARGQCLSSPDSESFTQFRGRLALMFNSQGKQRVRANVTHCSCGKWGLRTSVPQFQAEAEQNQCPSS